MQEKIAVGLLRRFLLGKGVSAVDDAARIVSHTGAVDGRLIDKVFPTAGMGAAQATLTKVKRMLVGTHPTQVLKQRMAQGGIFGKGGLIHGNYALNPELVEAVQNHGGVLNAFRKEPGQILNAVGDGANLAFTGALPAYAAVQAVKRDDKQELGRVMAETAGNIVAGPFGILGAQAIGHLSRAGENMFRPANPLPPMQAPQEYPQEALPRINAPENQGGQY